MKIEDKYIYKSGVTPGNYNEKYYIDILREIYVNIVELEYVNDEEEKKRKLQELGWLVFSEDNKKNLLFLINIITKELNDIEEKNNNDIDINKGISLEQQLFILATNSIIEKGFVSQIDINEEVKKRMRKEWIDEQVSDLLLSEYGEGSKKDANNNPQHPDERLQYEIASNADEKSKPKDYPKTKKGAKKRIIKGVMLTAVLFGLKGLLTLYQPKTTIYRVNHDCIGTDSNGYVINIPEGAMLKTRNHAKKESIDMGTHTEEILEQATLYDPMGGKINVDIPEKDITKLGRIPTYSLNRFKYACTPKYQGDLPVYGPDGKIIGTLSPDEFALTTKYEDAKGRREVCIINEFGVIIGKSFARNLKFVNVPLEWSTIDFSKGGVPFIYTDR